MKILFPLAALGVCCVWSVSVSLAGWEAGDAPARVGQRKPPPPPSPGSAKGEQELDAAGQKLFGLDILHQFHLKFTAREWEAMQPAMPGGFPGMPPGTPRAKKPAVGKPPDGRMIHHGNMVEFPIALANLETGGVTCSNVGVRFKGNFTYMATACVLKRSLKIDFAFQNEGGSRFQGLRKINLHAGVLDASKVREAVSYGVFREAGVPAPRTSFAEVTLTVPGKYAGELVGVFTMVEQMDKLFLARHCQNGEGLLMKPQGIRGPDFLGARWENYQDRYRPERPPTAEEAKRVIAFARLVNQADDESFRANIGRFLDMDRFLRFIAASALLVNLDSPLAMPQNFYLYLNPTDNRFVFLPWDLDISLAAWPFGGTAAQQMDLSLLHPHVGRHPLIDRLFAMEEIRQQYLKLVGELVAGAFSREHLMQNIGIIEQTVKEPLAREAKAVESRNEAGGSYGPGAITGGAPDPRTFVEKRLESVRAQLAGQRPGYTPQSQFHFPGDPPPGNPPGRFSPRDP